MTAGDPATANFGSLSSLAHRDKVESYVEMARKEGTRDELQLSRAEPKLSTRFVAGGTILCGGKRPTLPAPFDKGAFYEPTVIVGRPTPAKVSQHSTMVVC